MDETEVSKELSGLRKELYDARNLIIKTDNLLKTFHVELKSVADKQAEFERRHFMGHVAAYVVIGVLAAGGAILYGRSAGQASRAEAERLMTQAQEARTEADQARQKAQAVLEERQQASTQALEIWQQLTSDDPKVRQQGLDAIKSLDFANLAPFAAQVLQREERQLRERAATEAYEAGIAAYRRGDIREAKTALDRFVENANRLPQDWQTEWRQQANYYLGAADNQTGAHEEAVERLRRFLELGGTRSMRAYAGLLLGDSLEKLGRTAEARKAFEAGIAADPNGKTADTLRRRVARLPGGGQ